MATEFTDPGFGYELLDDRSFKLKVFIINGDNKITRIRKGAIQELIIEDSMLDFYHKGSIVIDNPHDVLERATKNYKQDGTVIDLEQFRFRSDARDFILLEFEPLLDKNIAKVTDVNNQIYTMKFLFAVYAIEDISADTTEGKAKKLHFWDYRYQLMRERNIYFSTAKVQQDENTRTTVTQKSDADRSISSGQAIQEIIKKTFPDDEIKFSDFFWDNGGTKTFYSSHSTYKAIDDLYNILDSHVSSDPALREPCILNIERFNNEWTLIPISKYFQFAYDRKNRKLGQFQLDSFSIATPAEAGKKRIPVPPKAPKSDGDVAIGVNFPDLNRIVSYEYEEMYGFDVQDLMVSTPVITHDYDSKSFHIKQKDHDIENVRNFIQENYISNLYGDEKTGAKTTMLIDKTRKDNLNFKPVFTANSNVDELYSYGRNKTILANLLMGNTIKFTVKGSTTRMAGRFISIDRENPYDDNDFESKLLGQYLVVNVVHRIGSNGYENEIIAVKPYLYKDLEYTEDLI